MNEEEKAAKLLELDKAMFDFMRAASRVRDIAWELEMEKLENYCNDVSDHVYYEFGRCKGITEVAEGSK